MSPLCVPTFSPIGACICVLWRILQSVQKEEKKRRKKTQTLAAPISKMAGVIFFKFGMWTPLPSWHFCSNFGFNRIRNHGATKVWKVRLLSSCKYTHGVARQLLGPYDTLLCVLINLHSSTLQSTPVVRKANILTATQMQVLMVCSLDKGVYE